MSGDESKTETKELLDKFNKYAKHLKLILAKVEDIDKKIDGANKPADDREKMNKIFEAKSIGRPKGDFQTKQQQYLKMLNDGKIKQPKSATTEYYRIVKDGDEYKLID